MIAAITSFLAELFRNFWRAIYEFGVDVLNWFLNLLNDVGIFFVDVFYAFLRWLIGLLPTKDSLNLPSAGAIPELFGTVNYFFPISEALLLVALWAGVFTVVGAIKFAKFLRGGG